MQTFLPYPDLRVSSQVLDDRRLGKQRVETFQILRALTWPSYAWKNHPAVRMWRGFVPGLVAYGLENCREWTRRGYADSVAEQLLGWSGGVEPDDPDLPPWFGLEALHLSHRSALLRKDPAFYRPLFDRLGNPGEPDDLPYLWPPDVFPRWPVRRGPEPLPLEEALHRLGYDGPRAGQAEAVAGLTAGRDVLLVMRPGTGGSSTALLAGLCLPGRTLWIRPLGGEAAAPAPEVPLVPWREVAGSDRPPPLARPPEPEDAEAMQAETAPAELCFATPDRVPPLDGYSLVVVDRADEVAGLERPAGGPPVLAVVGRADAAHQAELTQRLGLRTPLLAGGGWDPAGSRLEVAQAATPAARRTALVGLAGERGPALVVTASRERADRVVTTLVGRGLRAAAWAPPPMRAARATAAIGAWRSRRLDALVVPRGELPPLGRVRVRLLVGEAVEAMEAMEEWRDLVAALQPETAVLLTEHDPGDGCRRAALLASYGEPVAVPCGRCDVCAP